MRFTQHMMDRPKYVSVQYNEATQKYLSDWAVDNGFDMSKSFSGEEISPGEFDFHTTIFYTTTSHSMRDSLEYIGEFDCQPRRIIALGANKDVPVLEVYSPKLFQLRDYFERVYGMKSSFPDFIAHISLSYNWTGTQEDIDNISLPGLDSTRLTFDTLKITDAKG